MIDPPDICPKCGAKHTVSPHDKTARGTQRYYCSNCKKKFVLNPNTPKPVQEWYTGFTCLQCGNNERKFFVHSEELPSGSEKVRCTCCNYRFVPFPKIGGNVMIKDKPLTNREKCFRYRERKRIEKQNKK